jgi:hypothetical protein
VLVLVAFAALPVVSVAGPQDATRYELTRHLVLNGTLTVEPTLFDRAVYGGRSYSDKAPGMSFLAVPSFELERVAGIARAPNDWKQEGDASLWLMRVLTSGALFLLAVCVVGRLAESLVPRTGAATAAIFGAGTLAAPLAPTFFEHDAAAAASILAFALLLRPATRFTLVSAGFAAGVAVLFQYAAALIVLVLAAACAVKGARRLGWFALGGLPAVGALAAYDAVAFGSPFHLSYRYVTNRFTEQQHHGFFGIGTPTLGGLRDVLVGPRGLLVLSPVSVAAAAGLWLMWRRGRREDALLAAIVAGAFVLVDAGYFLPYGGSSPGPRFLVPALPFLALGLPFALARFPRTTLLLALISVVLTLADSVTWAVRKENPHQWLPSRDDVANTMWSLLGGNRDLGAICVLAAAMTALAVAGRSLRARAPA